MSSDKCVSRRDFLRIGSGSLGAGAAFGTGFGPLSIWGATNSLERDGNYSERLTIVIELSGGNDGLNTVVPVRSDPYYRFRPTLSIPEKKVLKLNSEVGLHPALTGLKRLWDKGALAIIQGAGCPNPSRSHSAALRYWRTAAPDTNESASWLSRSVKTNENQAGVWLPTRREPSSLAANLKKLAVQIRTRLPAQTCYLRLGGFDTHSNQKARHHYLLSFLANSLYGFFKDVDRAGRGKDVVVMIFSEFGRKVRENGGLGADHGTAAPMFLIGGRVKGGLYGAHPSLTDLDDAGDLKMTVDFRQVYATVIKEWMGRENTRAILGGDFPTLGIFS